MNNQLARFTKHAIEYQYINVDILVHPIQKAIIELSNKEKLEGMTLRKIGGYVGIDNSPQKVKHHLSQLVKMGVFDYIGGKFIRHQLSDKIN